MMRIDSKLLALLTRCVQFYLNYSKFVPKNSNAENAILDAKIGADTAFFGRALELVKPTCELLCLLTVAVE